MKYGRQMPVALIVLLGAAVLGAVVGPLPATAQGRAAEVVLLAPTRGLPLIGQVEVAFFFQGASDDEVIRAEVVLDDKVVATLEAPPWRTTIEAGEELGKRFLEVRATLAGGRSVRTALESMPVRFDEVEVRLVNLAVTVKDRSGDPVTGLQKSEFRVYDENKLVAIERWDPAAAGLAVALVLDTSLTMKGRKLDAAIAAAESFVRELREADRVAVLAFDESLRLVQPLTPELDSASAALSTLQAGGGTALYDAVYEAADALSGVEVGYRRVAIVLSDGRDESASGLEPGSFHTLDESVKKSHEQDVVIYTIGLGAELESQYDFSRRMTTAEVLRTLASSTGGAYYRPRRFSGLGRSYRDILDELRHQYSIAYTPAPPQPGETWRSIEVRVDVPGAEVRTREGYYVR